MSDLSHSVLDDLGQDPRHAAAAMSDRLANALNPDASAQARMRALEIFQQELNSFTNKSGTSEKTELPTSMTNPTLAQMLNQMEAVEGFSAKVDLGPVIQNKATPPEATSTVDMQNLYLDPNEAVRTVYARSRVNGQLMSCFFEQSKPKEFECSVTRLMPVHRDK